MRKDHKIESVIFLGIMTVALLLSGCGTNNTAADTSEPTQAQTAETETEFDVTSLMEERTEPKQETQPETEALLQETEVTEQPEEVTETEEMPETEIPAKPEGEMEAMEQEEKQEKPQVTRWRKTRMYRCRTSGQGKQ